MNSLRNLSGLTKANVAYILLLGIGLFMGYSFIIVWDLYRIVPYVFAFLLGQAITNALNDPESEEPVPLALRVVVGYGIGIMFGVGLMIVNSVIIKNLQYIKIK